MATKREPKKKEAATPAEVPAAEAATPVRAGRSRATAAHKPATRTVKSEPAAAAPATPVVVDAAMEHEEIAKTAYYFWLERNGADGHADADWFRAEQAVQSRRSR